MDELKERVNSLSMAKDNDVVLGLLKKEIDQRFKVLNSKYASERNAYQNQIKNINAKHEKAQNKYNQCFTEMRNKIKDCEKEILLMQKRHDQDILKLRNRHENVDSRFKKIVKLVENNTSQITSISEKSIQDKELESGIELQPVHEAENATQLQVIAESRKDSISNVHEILDPASECVESDELDTTDSDESSDDVIIENDDEEKPRKKRARKRSRRKKKNEDKFRNESMTEKERETGFPRNSNSAGNGLSQTIDTKSTSTKRYSAMKNGNRPAVPFLHVESDSYLQKAYQYLMELQDNASPKTDDETTVLLTTSTTSTKSTSENTSYLYKLSERVLTTSIEWLLRKREPTATEIIFHSGIFFTSNPGYRIQIRAQIDRLHGDAYFSVRVLKGVFDDHLVWPLQEKFCISLSPKMKCLNSEQWIIPSAPTWRRAMNKPEGKKDDIFSEWCGPFNVSAYVDAKKLIFDISKAS